MTHFQPPPVAYVLKQHNRALCSHLCTLSPLLVRARLQVQDCCSLNSRAGLADLGMNAAQLHRMCQDLDLTAGPWSSYPSAPSSSTAPGNTMPSPTARGIQSAHRLRSTSLHPPAPAWGPSATAEQPLSPSCSSAHEYPQSPPDSVSFSLAQTGVAPEVPPLTKQAVDLIVARCRGGQVSFDWT